MRIIYIQQEHQSATVYYDVNGVVMFKEIGFVELAEYLGIYDANLETVEIYAEQYLSDFKHHTRYENVQCIIDNQPEIAYLFKPYTLKPRTALTQTIFNKPL